MMLKRCVTWSQNMIYESDLDYFGYGLKFAKLLV